MIEASIRTVAAARIRRNLRSLVLLGLVSGLIGGVTLGAVAGARRTDSSYDRLIERTAFPDALVFLTEPRPGLADEIADLPSVSRSVAATFAVGLRRDSPTVSPIPVQSSGEPIARFAIVEGRRPDPSARDEVMVSPAYANEVGVDVGDTISYQALTDEDFAHLLRRGKATATGIELDLRVVGTFRTPTDVVLEEFPTLLGTPALHSEMKAMSSSAGVWVDLRPGVDADRLTAELEALAGPGSEERFNAVSVTLFADERGPVDDSLALAARGLLIAGAVVALAGVVLVAQMVARTAERERPDRRTLRHMGLSKRMLIASDVVSAWPLVAIAAVVAPLTALAVSATMPLGVGGLVEPLPGVDADLWVLVPGSVAVCAVVLALWTAVIGRTPPARFGAVSRPVPSVGGGATATLATWIAVGGSGRRTPRLMAFAGVVAVMAATAGVVVFGASLQRLVGQPERWGWPGELSIEATDEIRDDLFVALDAAPEVTSYAEVGQGGVVVDGLDVVAYSFESHRGDAKPLVLRGRVPEGPDEIALGSRILGRLDLDVGDVVSTDSGIRRVVGEAVTFGLSDTADHLSGALVVDIGDPEFVTAIVEVADDIDPEEFPAAVFPDAEYGSPVVPVEVSNLAELRPLLPLILVALAAITGVGVVHLGAAAAGRSRRDVAVLRAIGVSRSTGTRLVVRAVVLTVAVALAFAVPIGAVTGVRAWRFAVAGTDLATDAAWPPLLPIGALGFAVLATSSGAVAGRWVVRRSPFAELTSE